MIKNLYGKLPQTPGVYLMKNAVGKIIYVGKAVNLRRRVSSYFLRPQETRIAKMVTEIYKIDYLCTETTIEPTAEVPEILEISYPSTRFTCSERASSSRDSEIRATS